MPLRKLAWRIGPLLALLLALLGVKWAGESSVRAQLADGRLRVTFSADCRISMMAFGPELWEIRAAGGPAALRSVTLGVPPAGFQEVKTFAAGPLPATVDLSIKTHFRYGGEIVFAALEDGDKHDVSMSPVMNELSPVGDIC